MSMHPAEVKKVVDAGQSVIFKGRVVNKLHGDPMPSQSELVGDGLLRQQFAINLEREIAEKKAELEQMKKPYEPEAVEEKPEPEVAEVVEVKDEPKVVKVGKQNVAA